MELRNAINDDYESTDKRGDFDKVLNNLANQNIIISINPQEYENAFNGVYDKLRIIPPSEN